MEYTLQLINNSRVIRAVLSGKWDAQTDKAMALAVMSKVDDTGVDKVLIDMRELRFDLPMINLFERAKELREQRRNFILHSSRVALVYKPTDKKMDDDLKFFEDASQNRTLPYRVFKNVDSAVEWLLL